MVPGHGLYYSGLVCLRAGTQSVSGLALSRRFGDFASLRFDVSGQPQVVFHSVGPVQPSRQPARASPHSVSTGTPHAAARNPDGAPSKVRSSPMNLSVGAPPPQAPWCSGLDGGPSSFRPGPHLPPPPPLVPIRSQRDFGYQAGPRNRPPA